MGLKSKPKKAPESKAERALVETASARWRQYISTYAPAEKQLIDQASVTSGELAEVEGGIAGDAAAAASQLTQDTIRTVGTQTGDLSSGATKLALAGNADTRAATTGVGRALGRQGLKESELNKKVGLSAAGQGVATTVTDSLSAATSRANRLSFAAAQARAEKNRSRSEAFGAIAGATFRKTKWGEKAAEGTLFQQDELVTTPQESKSKESKR